MRWKLRALVSGIASEAVTPGVWADGGLVLTTVNDWASWIRLMDDRLHLLHFLVFLIASGRLAALQWRFIPRREDGENRR